MPPIAEALVEQRAVAEFKLYLPIAGRDIRTAIHACGQLAVLYPADAAAIAEVLVASQRRPSPRLANGNDDPNP